MPRYIDADALKEVHGMKDDCAECDKELRNKSKSCEFDRNYTLMDFCEWLDDAPTADVRENRKGKWIHKNDIGWGETWICSECGEKTVSTIMGMPRYKWCPMCGAEMRTGECEI